MRKKIICTIGPSSFKKTILKKFKMMGVNIFRINLSHTNLKVLEKRIKFIKDVVGINKICIDTEGAQIRTKKLKKPKFLKKNSYVSLGFNKNSNFNLYPKFNLKKINKNTKIYIGFDNLILNVLRVKSDIIYCKVKNPGIIDSNKGVHINKNINLKPLTNKDVEAIRISKKLGVKKFALSFTNTSRDLEIIRKLINKKDFLISKIETKKSLINLDNIIKKSNAILIDRGDLSRYVPIHNIPIEQLKILKRSKKLKKDTYVATNLLESMIQNESPTRAEANDIFLSLYHGANGLVLAAETAIGKNPIKCVQFVKKCISVSKKFIN